LLTEIYLISQRWHSTNWSEVFPHCPKSSLTLCPHPVNRACREDAPLPLPKAEQPPFLHTSASELVHLDLVGPFRRHTAGGCKYFLTIVDDYTRRASVHLLGQIIRHRGFKPSPHGCGGWRMRRVLYSVAFAPIVAESSSTRLLRPSCTPAGRSTKHLHQTPLNKMELRNA